MKFEDKENEMIDDNNLNRDEDKYKEEEIDGGDDEEFADEDEDESEIEDEAPDEGDDEEDDEEDEPFDEDGIDTEEKEPFRSGYVTIIGKPNVGKSTLLNQLIGEKLAIVTPKAQTTRDLIIGIYTDEECQIIFQDIPGVINPKDKFNECLMDCVAKALESHDIVFHFVDIHDKSSITPEIQQILANNKEPVFLVINKIDLLKTDFNSARFFEESRLDPNNYDEIIPISALKGINTKTLIEVTKDYLQPGPMYYDPEQLSDKDERFLVAEIVREKIYGLFNDEIPYSIATQVEEFKEKEEGKILIRTNIYVERESQKGMIIGKRGEILKQIGTLSRVDIEKLLGKPVYLELWVKVRKKWKKNISDLKDFGYKG